MVSEILEALMESMSIQQHDLLEGLMITLMGPGDTFSKVKIVHISPSVEVGILGGGPMYAPNESKY